MATACMIDTALNRASNLWKATSPCLNLAPSRAFALAAYTPRTA